MKKGISYLPNKEYVHSLLNPNKTLQQIADDNYISYTTLWRWMKHYNLKNKKRKLNEQEVSQLYSEGLSSYKIADIMNCSGTTVRRILKKNNIQSNYNHHRKYIDLEMVKSLRNDKYSLQDIANKLGVSYVYLYGKCKNNGISTTKIMTNKMEKNIVNINNETFFRIKRYENKVLQSFFDKLIIN